MSTSYTNTWHTDRWYRDNGPQERVVVVPQATQQPAGPQIPQFDYSTPQEHDSMEWMALGAVLYLVWRKIRANRKARKTAREQSGAPTTLRQYAKKSQEGGHYFS
jgi:hypothetical protein